MKYILFLLILISGTAYGQSTYYIRADSVRLQKVGGNTNLIIENGTRNKTGGYLRNYSNGRTDFYYAVDSVSVSGSNLILWRGGGTQNITVGIPAGATPPLQSVLTAGSMLTGNNTVDFNTNNFTFNTNGGYFIVESDDPGNVVQKFQVTGDASSRMQIQADGHLEWGPGTTGPDVGLTRSGDGTLSMNGNTDNVRLHLYTNDLGNDSSLITFGEDPLTLTRKASLYYDGANNRFGIQSGGNFYIDVLPALADTTVAVISRLFLLKSIMR